METIPQKYDNTDPSPRVTVGKNDPLHTSYAVKVLARGQIVGPWVRFFWLDDDAPQKIRREQLGCPNAITRNDRSTYFGEVRCFTETGYVLDVPEVSSIPSANSDHCYAWTNVILGTEKDYDMDAACTVFRRIWTAQKAVYDVTELYYTPEYIGGDKPSLSYMEYVEIKAAYVRDLFAALDELEFMSTK